LRLSRIPNYALPTGAATSYTYNTTSGKLTQRNLPESGRQNIRTSYSYDRAGRLEYETVTREAPARREVDAATQGLAALLADSRQDGGAPERGDIIIRFGCNRELTAFGLI